VRQHQVKHTFLPSGETHTHVDSCWNDWMDFAHNIFQSNSKCL